MLNDSYVGGSFAPEMKFAGYDMIIVTGRAPEPTVVCIKDDVVESQAGCEVLGHEDVRDRGCAARATSTPAPRSPRSAPPARTACPGPASRPTSTTRRDAAVTAGSWEARTSRRSPIRGTGTVSVGDAKAFLADMRRMHAEYVLTDDNLWANEEGTPDPRRQLMSDAGAIPTRNWSAGSFEGMEKHQLGRLPEDQDAATGPATSAPSPVASGTRCDDVKGEGPEYETIALCGANCGVGDIEALMKFNAECDEYGARHDLVRRRASPWPWT